MSSTIYAFYFLSCHSSQRNIFTYLCEYGVEERRCDYCKDYQRKDWAILESNQWTKNLRNTWVKWKENFLTQQEVEQHSDDSSRHLRETANQLVIY